MPAKVSVSERATVTAGIGERGRGGEPVGGGDVEADRSWAWPRAGSAARRGWPRPGRRSRRPRTRPGPVRRAAWSRPAGSARRTWRGRSQHPGTRAGELGRDIGRRHPPADLAPEREDQGHRRIEVRARERPEDGDQHHQRRAGRQRVAQQRDGVVPARQPLAHDPGADHDGQQQRRPQRLRRQAPTGRERMQGRLERSVLHLSSRRLAASPARGSNWRRTVLPRREPRPRRSWSPRRR